MSATTHNLQEHIKSTGVPPIPPEAHQEADPATRSWEQVIKFDCGLAIGKLHCIELENCGGRRAALVEISSRGHVYLLAKPAPGDMYSSWRRVIGDAMVAPPKGRQGVIVWGARDPELMRRFDNPAAIARKG